MKKYICFTVFLVTINIFPQIDTSYIRAYPIIGWDSLKNIIERPETFPEIPRRAEIGTTFSVYLFIDSTGNLVNIKPTNKPTNLTDTLNNRFFIPKIEKVLKPIKWFPGSKSSIPINDRIYVLFNFSLYDPDEINFNIKAPHFNYKTNIN
jgi:hypothetical protein